MVHVVNKGKAGEREAVKFLQPTVDKVYKAMGMEPPQLYRNQNQSALGGYDLSGLPWIAFEIKRQENLSINSWWNQVNRACVNGEIPVVMFRQNHKKWRFLMPLWGHTGGPGHMKMRAEVTPEEFLAWFEARLVYEVKKESESTND